MGWVSLRAFPSVGNQRVFLFVNPRLTGVCALTRPTARYSTLQWGGGAPNSETTGPIVKIQTAPGSPGNIVERSLMSLTSRSSMTSQVRSK